MTTCDRQAGRKECSTPDQSRLHTYRVPLHPLRQKTHAQEPEEEARRERSRPFPTSNHRFPWMEIVVDYVPSKRNRYTSPFTSRSAFLLRRNSRNEIFFNLSFFVELALDPRPYPARGGHLPPAFRIRIQQDTFSTQISSTLCFFSFSFLLLS